MSEKTRTESTIEGFIKQLELLKKENQRDKTEHQELMEKLDKIYEEFLELKKQIV